MKFAVGLCFMLLASPAFATTTLSPEVLAAAREGEAMVMVAIAVPELSPTATEQQIQMHQQSVKVMQDQVLQRVGIAPDDPRNEQKYGLKRFSIVGGFALRADQNLLNLLAQDPAVESIKVDEINYPL